MTNVLIFATILAPIILAMVELIKRTATIKKNYIPLMAFEVGIFIGFAGLSATGLFELSTHSKGDDK